MKKVMALLVQPLCVTPAPLSLIDQSKMILGACQQFVVVFLYSILQYIYTELFAFCPHSTHKQKGTQPFQKFCLGIAVMHFLCCLCCIHKYRPLFIQNSKPIGSEFK